MTALQQYVRELREDLPEDAFQPVPSRLIWLPVHLASIGSAVFLMLGTELGLAVDLVLAAAIGNSYACLGMLAHEILHGTVIRNRRWQDLVAGFCFVPHCIPPGVWRAWHNRMHHGQTGKAGVDPDGFNDPVLYRRNRWLVFALSFMPGSRHLQSILFFPFYFSVHVLFVLFFHSKRHRYWSRERRRLELTVFAGMVTFWATVLLVVGPVDFLFLHVLPLMVANAIQLAYLVTNHWLCDETPHENDPLVNSLSVKVPRLLDWMHFNLSYHLEHHLAPNVNPRFAPLIRKAMVARYGSRCRRVPIWRALRWVFQTPRVHLSDRELVDLEDGSVYSTLGHQAEPPQMLRQEPLPIKKRKTRENTKRTAKFPERVETTRQRRRAA